MGAFLTAVLSWFLGAFTRLFSVVVTNFLATKVIMGTLFIVILPIILNNVIHSLMESVFSAVQTFAAAHSPTLQTAISFTGLAGYFLDHLGLISALTVVLSAVSLRFALSWIPFVGPK